MKHKIKPISIVLLIITLALVFAIAACNTTSEPKLEVTVSDNVNVKVGDSFDYVKQYLIVTYYNENGQSRVLDSSDYVIKGVLAEGTVILSACYGEVTKTFELVVAPKQEIPEEKEKYTVTFNSNGGSAVNSVTDLESGAKINEPLNPEKTGYTFDGWYKDDKFKSAWIFNVDSITDNLTLYAKWNVNSYKVKFCADGIINPENNLVVEYKSLISDPNLREDGFDLNGWYIDDKLTVKWNFDTDLVEKDITLYAEWVSLYETVSLKNLHANISAYKDKYVVFEGICAARSNRSPDVYIQDYDSETGLNYGIYVFCGFSFRYQPVFALGNLVRVYGVVGEFNGKYQVTNVSYDPDNPSPKDIEILKTNQSLTVGNVSAADLQCKKEITYKDWNTQNNVSGEFDTAMLICDTRITLSNLTVTEVQTITNGSNQGGLILTCVCGEDVLTVRTGVLYIDNELVTPDYFDGKNIDLTGIVDYNYEETSFEIRLLDIKDVKIL